MLRRGTRVLWAALLMSVFTVHQVASTQATDTPAHAQLSAAEQALVELMTDYYAELDTWFDALRSYETPVAREKAIETGEIVDPGARYIPQLLAFETEHHGEDVGLLALWHVFRQAASSGRFDDAANVGRREAVTRLVNYERSPLLPIAVTMALRWKPNGYDSVQRLCSSPTVPSATRDMLQYFLADYSLKTRAARQFSVKRVDVLRNGGEPANGWPGELENHLAMLAAWPSEEVLDERCVKAMRTLEELAEQSPSPRFPGINAVDDRGFVVRLGDESKAPHVSEKAAAALFKERHLVIGADAPSLEATLLDGTTWRLVDQLGKVVVIQFSFTGCGPCEQMYPDLTALTAQYPDELEIVTLLRDETPVHALEATESGKFTWSIALDGYPGRVATKWSVSGFPTIYVIDKSGKIAAKGLRGDELRDEVARLAGAAG